MRSNWYRGFIGAFWFFIAAVTVLAQAPTNSPSSTVVPKLINYSGVLNDPIGRPLSGLHGVTFLLYKDQQGGAPVWIETQNVTLDKTGRYDVTLGATKSTGVPTELFASGEARWLGVQVAGESEQARVLLVAVPYALKAADAETVGGLPASAFVLAAPPSLSVASGSAAEPSAGSGAASPGAAVTGSGTQNFVPLWTNSTGALGNSVMFQSGTGSTAKIGINTTTPSTNLDVKGSGTVRGAFNLPAIGAATAASGKNSQPLNWTASAFNSTSKVAVNQVFRWQAEPVGNNSASPSGVFDLLYGSGSATPAPTGLKIASNGLITFAAGQTFPGTGSGGGTVTSVGSGLGLTGGPITSSGTLGINTTVVPQLNASNTFTGNQTVNGNLTATGLVTGTAFNIGSNLFASGSFANGNAFLGFAGNTTTTGSSNSATGYAALSANTTGNFNTANGSVALLNNTSGSYNTASGFEALSFNNTGTGNAAHGSLALSSNTTGINNVASGYQGLFSNTTGNYNMGSGYNALYSNTTGGFNVGTGPYALYSNTTGFYNTASGYVALYANTTGYYNTAIGFNALPNNGAGSGNIALGYQAAVNLTSGDNNIHIGNPGLSSESNTIRIGTGGTGGHTAFFVAGVLTSVIGSGQPVYISSTGQLGVVTSSRRYKDDIQDMAEASDRLLKLRPVTFHYKQPAADGSKPLQYGLIAEEVAEVYPDAVTYNDAGEPDGVQYHKINAMLLNEVQKQAREIEELKASIAELKALLKDHATN
jgi:trimeric autotransporter adhesin